MAFGLWGYFVGEVGIAIAVVGAMTLGIVVDDTVHFLSKYLRGWKELGKNPEDSIKYAFSTDDEEKQTRDLLSTIQKLIELAPSI